MISSYVKYGLKMLNPRISGRIILQSAQDFFNGEYRIADNGTHTRMAMEWLCRAQDATKTGGVSSMYSLLGGWQDPYPETTGYIIPTFFNYYEASKDKIYRKLAIEMADWELTVQLKIGAFPGGGGNKATVFNTGQIIMGLTRAYKETKKKIYKKAAAKAGNWLIEVQDKEGYWKKDEYLNTLHTYNTRTAWSLLMVEEIMGPGKYRDAAVRNLDWAMGQQQANGWFKNNGFYEGQEPILHTIAYAMNGFLDSGLMLGEKKFIFAAKQAADALLKLQQADGSLLGTYDANWNGGVKWSNLTGNAQTSIVWLKLYYRTKQKKYLEAARKINKYNKSKQSIDSANPGIRGGIKGAHPIYGWYAPFCYINWGAKFFVDSLMLEEDKSLIDKI